MTAFNDIPVTPEEDRAWRDLGAGAAPAPTSPADPKGKASDHGEYNGADPAPSLPPERLTGLLSPPRTTPRQGRPSSQALAGTTSHTKEPRRSVHQAGLTTTEGATTVSRRRLADSTAVPVLGIWALYAWMFWTALEAVR